MAQQTGDRARGRQRTQRLLAPVTVALATLGALLALPAQAQSDSSTVTIWSAALTVGNPSGFPDLHGWVSGAGELSGTGFDLGDTTYTISQLYADVGEDEVYISFSAEPDLSDFSGATFKVGTHSLSFADATKQFRRLKWGSSAASDAIEAAVSVAVSITVPLVAPGKVTGVMVDAGVGELTVSWSAVTGASKYRVQWKSGSEEYDSAREQLATETSYTIQDLVGGTEYSVQVIAVATAGGSDKDGEASATQTGTPTLPELSIADAGGGEATARVVFTVSLSGDYHQDVSANWSTSSGTATAGADYTTVSNAALTVARGSTAARLTVTVANDTTDEPPETFTVTLSDPANATLSTTAGSATGTIADDDLSTVNIAAVAASVTEGAAVAFVVSRGIADNAALTVNLESSATGNFLAATPPTSMMIAAGAMSATVSVATDDDEVIEETGSLTLTIQDDSGYERGSDSSATVTIGDNDARFTLGVAGGGTVNEGSNAAFTVTLSEASASEQITVRWDTRDGTAKAPGDYSTAGGTLTFAASATALTRQLTVSVSGDGRHEAEEQFAVELSNATGTGAAIGAPRATATIRDNDVPALSIVASSAAEDAGTIGFPVTLSLESEVQVMVDYRTSTESGDTATAGSDYTANSGTLTFPAGSRSQTIAIALLDDMTADEPDETFTVTLSDPSATGTGSSTPTLASPVSVQGTIVDDDGPPVLSIADASAGEGAGSISFVVSLSAVSAQSVSASWSTADDTATAGNDYSAVAGGTLSIAAGATVATVAVTVNQDSVDEPPERFTVALSAPVNAIVSSTEGSAAGTIEDDDLSTVTIAAVDATVREGTAAAFAVRRGIADSVALAVSLSATPTGSFIAATLPTAAMIPAGAMSTTVAIATVDDEVSEAHGSVGVAIRANAGAYLLGTPATATVSIQDDDATFAATISGGGSVTEGGAAPEFAVTLTPSPAGRTPVEPLTVRWATADGTAESSAGDYTAAAATLTFAAGAGGAALTQRFSVAVGDDGLHEPQEQFTVALTDPTGKGASLGTAAGVTVTIADNDVPELNATAASADESAGPLRFPVTLNLPSAVEITVQYATSDGTASSSGPNADYTAATGALTFASGTTAGTVLVEPVDDSRHESDETFTLTLSSPAAASGAAAPTLGNAASVEGTIVDDDGNLPRLSIADTTVTEGAFPTTMTFTVTADRAPAANQPVGVDWRAADGTATGGSDGGSGVDYGPQSGRASITPGSDSAVIQITVFGDTIDEPDETFTVTLSNPRNATLSADATATGTIVDDDLPTVTVAAVAAAVSEGDTARFEVRRETATDSGVEVLLSSSQSGSYITAALPTSAQIPAGSSSSTVAIATIDNQTVDADGSVTVAIVQNADLYHLGSPSSATVTIGDNDGTQTLDLAGVGTVDEGAGGAVFTVTLSAASAVVPITVDWRTADGTAQAPDDYTAADGTLTFASGASGAALTQTFTVAINDDSLDESDETFSVTLGNAAGADASIGTSRATVTIGDNDGVPVLSIADASAAENEGPLLFLVTLNPASGSEVTVDYTTGGGSATAGEDYTTGAGTLTFAAGARSRTISISLIDDEDDESDETFEVTLTNPSANAELAGDAAATGTIVNDDAAPVQISVSDVACPESIGNNCFARVSLSKGHAFTIVVVIKTQDGNAKGWTGSFEPGFDFKHRVRRALTFDPSDSARSTNMTFNIGNDLIDEEDETFTYTATVDGDVNVEIADGEGTVTILDDDPPSSVSIADGSAEEHDGAVSFAVSLDSASGKHIGVAWETGDGTATAGDDYTADTGTLTFAPGDTVHTISVGLIDDADREEDGESFQVTLSRAAGTDANDLALGDPVATGTIAPSDLNSSPTGVPVIIGTPPTVGVELTVDISGIADADGLPAAESFGYQWIVDDGTGGTDIDGQMASAYTPRDGDVGKTLAVEVTFTDNAHTVETVPSDPTETVAAAPPGLVTGVTVTADVEQLLVSWNPVADADGYQVQWLAGSELAEDEVGDGTTTEYTIRSLVPGTEYTVQVSALRDNARVDGVPSAPVSASPKASSPGQVTGVVLTPAAEALEVTWTPVTDPAAAADGYKVQWKSGAEEFGAERQDQVSGGATDSHTISGLDPDVEYSVQVVATRQFADDGPASPAATATPQHQPPGQVTGVVLTSAAEALEVTWGAVAAADGYRVQWKSGAEEFGADREAAVAGDSTGYTISPLSPGTEYTVQVISTRDNAAEGLPSAPVAGIPAAPVEDQVSGVTLLQRVGSLEVSWNEEPGALGYRVQWRSGTEEFNTGDRQHVITGATNTSHVIGNLNADRTYIVQVTATFSNYDGPPSSPATGRPQYPAPGQVTGVAVASEVRQLRVTWNQASDATGYQVQWRSGNQDFGSDREAVVAGGATTAYVIPSLNAGTEYTVRVVAVRDNAEDGPPSDSTTGTPQAPLPGQVAGVNVTAGVGELTVTWIEASDATGYRVQWRSGTEEFGAEREAVVAGAAATEYTIPSLEAGAEYAVRVIATNDGGEAGAPSLEVNATPKVAAAGQVGNVTVTPGVEQLEVTWDEATDADGYRVQWKSGEQEYDSEREAVIDGAANTGYTIQSLEVGTEYTVQVLATRQNADDALPSEPVTGTPRAPASGQVSGVRVQAGVEQLTVSWNAVGDASGYKVRWKSGEQEFGPEREAVVAGSATTEYAIRSLQAGTEYTVQVMATRENAADGLPSSSVTGIPQAPPPGQVINVTVTPGEAQLAVSWDQVDDADGYRVQWSAGTRQFSAVVSGGSTSYVIQSLSPGVEYTVQVVATRDNAPDGPPSDPVAATPAGTTGADVVSPTVTVASSANFPATAAFRVNIAFSENVTGFALDDIQVHNGAATDLSGAGAAYRATITPRADFEGSVTVTVAAAAAVDAAGNDSLAGSARFAVDTRAPTVQDVTLDQELDGWTTPTDTGAASASGLVRYPDGAGSAGTAAAPATGSPRSTVTLIWDESLDATATPVPGAFAVRVAGSPRAVTAVSVGGTRVQLRLATPVAPGQTVTVSYDAAVPAPIRDLAGNAAANLQVAVANADAATAADAARYARVNRILLPYAAAAMHTGTLAAVSDRIAAAGAAAVLPPAAATAGTGALAAAGLGGAASGTAQLGVEELLRRTDFVLPLAAGATSTSPGAGSVALWGRGGYRHLSGPGEDAVDWSGGLTSFQVGTDLRVSPELLAGVAVAWAQGAFDYTDRSAAVNAARGEYETELLSVHPYAGWWLPGGGLGLWMSAGYGWGELRIDDRSSGGRQSSAMRLVSGAVGGSGRLLATDALVAGGTTLVRLKGEGSVFRLEVEESSPIVALAADNRKLRLLLEGSHAQTLPWGGRLTPALDVGVHHNDGDGPQGHGWEFGGRLSYADPWLGLTLQGHGRLLADHRLALQEWEAGGLLRLELDAGGRGLWLSVAPSWGTPAGAAQALSARGAAAQLAGVSGAGNTSDAAETGRLHAMAGYGLPAGRSGLLTPYGGMSLAGSGARDYRAGLRLEFDALELRLEGTRHHTATGPASHGITFAGALSY